MNNKHPGGLELTLNFSSLQTLAASLQADPENPDRVQRAGFFKIK